MCFAKQPKKRELRMCSKAFISLISSEAHQTRASHLQSSTQGSLAHACACMAASVNIRGSYLCTLLSLKIHERCSPAAAAPSRCVEAAGTGTAAWSLQRHRFLFKKLLWHLNSSDLAPISTLWSRTQLAGEQVSHPFHARAVFFALQHHWKHSCQLLFETNQIVPKKSAKLQPRWQLIMTWVVNRAEQLC